MVLSHHVESKLNRIYTNIWNTANHIRIIVTPYIVMRSIILAYFASWLSQFKPILAFCCLWRFLKFTLISLFVVQQVLISKLLLQILFSYWLCIWIDYSVVGNPTIFTKTYPISKIFIIGIFFTIVPVLYVKNAILRMLFQQIKHLIFKGLSNHLIQRTEFCHQLENNIFDNALR